MESTVKKLSENHSETPARAFGTARCRIAALLGLSALCLVFALSMARPHEPTQRTQTTYYLYIMMNAQPGTDTEFNRWYDEQHVPDLMRIPGFVSAQRFMLADVQFHGQEPRKYMVVFEIRTDDLAKVYAEINRRIANGTNPTSPVLDVRTAVDWTFVPIGPHQFAKMPQ